MKVKMSGNCVVLATKGCYCAEDVEVAAVLQELTITENGDYTPPDGVVGFSKVTANVESGGKVAYNIAYGDTEPDDTSKLWVKTAEPEEVQISSDLSVAENSMELNVNSIPTSTYGIGTAAVGTKIYLFGGYSSSYLKTINVFDTETKTITTLSTTLPTAANNIGTAAVGTKIYLFGGYDGSRLNTINVFDTETNTITTLSTWLPSYAYAVGASAVGTKIYLFGGYSKDGTLSVYQRTINVFDTETNTITTLSARLPSGAYGIGTAAVGTRIYLFGGYDGSRLNTINVFDTETNTITTLSTTLPTAAHGIGTAAVGTKIYLFGGHDGNGYLYTINAFTIKAALAANRLFLQTSLNENLFDLLPLMRIGVNGVYLGNAEGYAEKVDAALYADGAWNEI